MEASPPPTVDARAVHLECRGLRKAFGSTVALDGVWLGFRASSVHALVGENGAGKSTLGKIVAGVVAPDRGELRLGGSRVAFASPRHALEHGIAMVAQELALVPRMTVAENTFLGIEPVHAGFVDRRQLAQRFGRLVEEVGFDLDPDARVGRLPLAKQQEVEILRALARDAELIVFDEPTAALSGSDAERLHHVVRTLAAAGRSVVLISHFLSEVLDLADTITVLRDGQVVRTGPAADETESSLIAGMLGRSAGRTYPRRRAIAPDATSVLRVTDLVAPGVRGVSLEVRAGEIVGLAGLIGAGRSEVARAVFGATQHASGNVVSVGGRSWHGPAEALRSGLAFIPESRKLEGLMLARPVRENVSLAALPRLSQLGWVRRQRERGAVTSALERATTSADPERPAAALSGGNQQKLLFARALLVRPRLLIADEPTRGIDVGAKRAIYELLVAIASEGVGILLISSEIEELLGLAHRVLVMRDGRITAELEGPDMTERGILHAAFETDSAAA